MSYRLLILDAPKKSTLKAGRNIIGRIPKCDIQITHPYVSRIHAEVTVSERGVKLTDLNSVNGTFFEGKLIKHPVAIQPGDVFLIGKLALQLIAEGEDEDSESFLMKHGKLTALIHECTSEMMECLLRNPEDLYKIHPGTFEKIIARIFENDGFDVELIGSWNQADGGVDIVAVKKSMAGIDLRLAIQCKRFKKGRRVSAEPIRSLAGVLDRFRAHMGVLATTSYFARGAEDEVRAHLWRISLRDREKILNDLEKMRIFEKSNRGLWVSPQLSSG